MAKIATIGNTGTPRPCPNSAARQADFEARALRLGYDPHNRWIGGYVDYEWDHLRLVLEALPLRWAGRKVLEFGCNVGASAILLRHLGARMCATEHSADWLGLARLNAARYGIDDIDFLHAPDSRRLPFADGHFDMVACNSVLEYVDPADCAAVQRELDRVLAPGGMILLTGTSNRLWPREVHSGRWLLNYLPRWLDRPGRPPAQRGLWPWTARHGFGPHYDNLDTARDDGFFARSRRGMGAAPRRLRALLWLAARLGVGPGLLTQNMSCLLRKRGRPAAPP